MIKKLIVYFFMLLGAQANAKVLIFTYAYNRPDFVEIQYKTLKSFCTDDYEFIVFSDARSQDMKNKIREICAHYKLKFIQVPQAIHDRPYLPRLPREDYNYPSIRNVNVVQYSLDLLGFNHNDILILLDSDLFLVKEFSFREFLKGYDLGGFQLDNGYIKYLWHGLAFLDMSRMPNKRTLNFNCGIIEGRPADAGGYSYYYFQNNPQVKSRYVDYHYSGALHCNQCKKIEAPYCIHNTNDLKNVGFNGPQIEFLQSAYNVEFFCNNSFLHYRGGTNWDRKSQEYHHKKTLALQRYLHSIL